ncbi:600_t:CDS:2, partial [Dentiscutata erythropus]
PDNNSSKRRILPREESFQEKNPSKRKESTLYAIESVNQKSRASDSCLKSAKLS